MQLFFEVSEVSKVETKFSFSQSLLRAGCGRRHGTQVEIHPRNPYRIDRTLAPAKLINIASALYDRLLLVRADSQIVPCLLMMLRAGAWVLAQAPSPLGSRPWSLNMRLPSGSDALFRSLRL